MFRVMAPITGPATPPIPPLMAFPPMTTPVMEFKVMEAPISAFPDPLNMVMAMPDNAAMNPETTYVLNWISVTGTAVSYAASGLPPTANRYLPKRVELTYNQIKRIMAM